MRGRGVVSFLKGLWGKRYVRLLTSLCILAILLAKLPLSDLWLTIRQVSVLLWAFVVTAFVSGHLFGVFKWRLLITMGQNKMPFSVALRCYFAGLFANLFLPSLAGGDVIRAGLAIRFNGEKGAVIFGSLLDRFLDICSLLLIILTGALYSPESLGAQDQTILFLVLFLMMIVILSALVLLITPLRRLVPKRLSASINRIRNIIEHLIKNPQRALVAFAFAMLIQGGFVLLGAVLGAACGIYLPVHVWWLTWPLAKLSAMVPVSMGGLGVREVALAAFLNRFGVPFSSSVGLGLLWETVLIAGGGIGGLFYLLSSRYVPRTDLFALKSSPYRGTTLT